MHDGNRCGHRPEHPRWFAPPALHARRPGILVKLGEKLKAYYPHPDVLPSLNAANGSSRQQRSERREACVQLLGAVVHYLDLVTLRVGIPGADGLFQGLTLDFLASVSGLGLRRAERAASDLARAGMLTTHPIAERHEGGYRGFAAIRTLHPRLFAALGLGAWLRHERDKASTRLRKKLRKQAAKAQANFGLMFRGASCKPKAPEPKQPNKTQILRDLMLANPGRPIEELFELLRGPPP